MPKPHSQPSIRLEALLFASGGPLKRTVIAKAFDWSDEQVNRAIVQLKDDLSQRGLLLISGDDGYELSVATELRSDVARALKFTAQPLSQSALEALTIVAYKQPITKSSIDEIRGVANDSSLKTLLARDLIVLAGKVEGGLQYRTTNHFLRTLGLSSLEDLPKQKGLA